MTAKAILQVVPTIQAISLTGMNLQLAKKKRKRTKDFVGAAASTSVGAALLRAESEFINMV